MIKPEILKKATAKDLKDINILIAQLSLGKTSPKPVTIVGLKKMLAQKNFYFIVVRRGGVIVAFGTVHFFYMPSGLAAETGDLVVDKKYRALGIGRVVLEKMIELAEKDGATHVSLRTNPKRKDALKMYDAMGLKKWDTNFYRVNFPRS